MNKWFSLVAGILLVTATGAFADFLDEDTLGIRADVVVDPDSSDDPTIGYELGFGGAVFALDDVGIFGAYRDDDDMTLKSAGGYIEQHLKTGTLLWPYIGAGLAYGWLDLEGGDNIESVYLRFSGGVKIALSEWLAINAGVLFSVSTANDIFLDEDGNLEDTNLEYVAGIRIYY